MPGAHVRRCVRAGAPPRRVIALLTWLPLLLLSAFGSRAFSGVEVPFLRDFEVHIRFLVALPLFVAAELVVHDRMRFVLRQFLERKLVSESDLPRFEAAVASAFRLRNSVLAELLLCTGAPGPESWKRGIRGSPSTT